MRYWTSGEVPIGEDFIYVERPCDRSLWKMFEGWPDGKIIALYGCRQSGKTSLLNRLSDRASKTHRTVCVNVDTLYESDSANYPTEISILDELLSMVAEKAGCYAGFLDWRDKLAQERSIANTNAHERFQHFVEELLVAATEPTLLILDEFDRFAAFGIRWQFLMRCLYEHVRGPAADRVRIVIAGLLRPTDLIAELDNSKLTMFDSLWIGDFDPADPSIVKALARGLRNPPGIPEENAVRTVLAASGGHPYLTVNLLEQICVHGATGAVEGEIKSYIGRNKLGRTRLPGEADEHFNYAASYMQQFPDQAMEAVSCYERLRSGDKGFDLSLELTNVLRGAGLVSTDTGQPRIKSRIVSEVYDETWIEQTRSRFLTRLASSSSSSNNLAAPRIQNPALPRVLILNMGGTLGMDVDPKGNVIPPIVVDRFLADIPAVRELVDPIVEQPFTPRDGANITPSQWKDLARVIDTYRDSDIAGVVVMSGTDTMAFSASAVAFALAKTIRFPVVFVGAQARRSLLFADPSPNLLRACLVAREGRRLPQVVIAFNDQVFRAVRADKKDDYRYEGFWAPNEGPIAVVVEDVRYQIDPATLEGFSDSGSEAHIDFEEHILTISQRPGLRPEIYQGLVDAEKVKGVVIESLGVGNLPTIEDYSFEQLIRGFIAQGIPVLISSRYPVQPDLAAFYAPAKAFLALDAMSAGDMVPPAATTKFMWGVAEIRRRFANRSVDKQTRLRALSSLMGDNLIGEIRRDVMRRLTATE
jgi:L-asparaginase